MRSHVATLDLEVDGPTAAVFGALARIGRPPTALDPEVDRSDLFARAVPLGFANVVHDAYRCDPDVGGPGTEFGAYAALATALTDVQRQFWLALADDFAAAGIPSLVLKGMYLFSHVYRGTPRFLADVDVLVRSEDSARAVALARAAGYASPDGPSVARHYQLPNLTRWVTAPGLDEAADFLQRCTTEAYHLFRRLPDGRSAFSVDVSLHENVTVPRVDVADLWDSPQEVTVGGTRALAPSVAVVTWLYAMRCYAEIAGLRDRRAARYLADLVAVARATPIPYDRVVALAAKYGTAPSVFYTLRWVRDLGEVDVPDAVLDDLQRAWRSSTGGRQVVDRGDLLPFVLGRTPVTFHRQRVLYRLTRPLSSRP